MTLIDSKIENIPYLVSVYICTYGKIHICTYGRILFRHGDSIKCFHLSEFQSAKIIF